MSLIVKIIFLLICSNLGLAAFSKTLKKSMNSISGNTNVVATPGLSITPESQCSTIDYSKDPGLDGIPQNQGESGWCYLYSAADILSHKLGKRVSVPDLLMLHNYRRNPANKRLTQSELMKKSGWAAYALKMAFEKGVCADEITPTTPGGRDLYRAINRIEEVKKSKKISGFYYSRWKELFPKVTTPVASNIFLTSTPENIIRDLALANCPKRISLPNMTFEQNLNSKGKGYGDSLVPHLNNQIKNGPVIINYDSAALLPPNKNNQQLLHFSTIVGRMWNPSKSRCEFLLRNSWGTTEEGYRQGLKVTKGHVWIDENFLKENLFETLSLKDKQPLEDENMVTNSVE